MLEKHITEDRGEKGVDHEAALDPEAFARFVRLVRDVDPALNALEPEAFCAAEKNYRRTMKKSIVAAWGIGQGEIITEEMIRYVRSEPGLAPSEADTIIGHHALRAIARYEPIQLIDVSPRAEEPLASRVA